MPSELQPMFWGAATLGLYALARAVNRRHPAWWSSPLLLTWALCFILALSLHASYRQYIRGTGWLLTLLGPTTVAFAIPIYRERALIRRHWPTLAIGVAAGCAIAVASSWLLATWLRLTPELRLSLLPRSITTPFAMIFSEDVGGVPELTATCVVFTGVFGASMGELLLKWLPVRSSFARGAMLGMGAHGAGVAKAREVGNEEASIAGLVMVLAGLACVMVAPLFALCLS